MSDPGERLELVTSFESLRAGDLIIGRPCGYCGRAHRGILTQLLPPQSYREHDGTIWNYAAWKKEPRLPCGHWGISPHAVTEKRVYRVLIPPAASSQETARPKKLERVR